GLPPRPIRGRRESGRPSTLRNAETRRTQGNGVRLISGGGRAV
ncbi:MAG: hypothetical protein, partial [Olavius algarvensis Gamma 1 endosymbiont]